MQDDLKLNLGCGSRLLDEYVNIDQDDIASMRQRYPDLEFPKDQIIHTYDVFDLPYKADSVQEIIANGFIEHLSFVDEKRFFEETIRVLKPGGQLNFSVPNFEEVVKLWLKAEDNWLDFYSDSDEAIEKKHWFGTYTYEPTNKWGYLAAMIFGSQNGEGQYHKNCYTEAKIHAMLTKIGFSEIEVQKFQWKGDRDPMLRAIAIK